MKHYLVVILIFLASSTVKGQNLIDSSTWQPGTLVPEGFFKIRAVSGEDELVVGTNPFGANATLWKGTKPGTDGGPDGGFRTATVAIDATKTYRIAVWIKKENSLGGTLRCRVYSDNASNESTVLSLEGVVQTNALIEYLDTDMVLDKWYLLVGFIHKSDYTGNGVTGGLYDGETKQMIRKVYRDFKFTPEATSLDISVFAYNVPVGDPSTIFFYGPRIEEVNGSEASIANVLSGESTDPVIGTSLWQANSAGLSYTDGSVKIGTTKPDGDYLFTVNGKMHAKELKVDLDGALAPDYVFYEDYKLKTLAEVQEHINTKGHLPNIPSAATMAQEGMHLKMMNLKLLEKIEELTLYTIDQEKRIAALEAIIKVKN